MTVILENYHTTDKLNNNENKCQASAKYLQKVQKYQNIYKRCRKYQEYLWSREKYIYAIHLKTGDLHIIFVSLLILMNVY